MEIQKSRILYLGNSVHLAELVSSVMWAFQWQPCLPHRFIVGTKEIMQVEVHWGLEAECKCQKLLCLQDADFRA